MPISFNSANQTFKLDTSESSYIIEIFEQNYLLHLYYGAKLPDDNVSHLRYHGSFASFSASNEKVTNNCFSADVAPMEYSCEGAGDNRISALGILNSDGNNVTDIRYVSHKIYAGKPSLDGLPSLYVNSDDEAQTLELVTEDKVTGVVVTLFYTVFSNHPVITRSVKVENRSENSMRLERIYSCCVELPTMKLNMLDLYGRWLKERTLQTRPLAHGIQSISSKRGSSSHNHNPFVALCSSDATEETGEAYGFNLVYSGNFAADIEVDSYGSTRLIMGINPETFGWLLEPGDSFYAPEIVMVYSANGVGAMSRAFHKIYSQNLIRGKWKTEKRPLLINSWEAAYFDFDTDKLVRFASHAKELGIEMLVMDDGWFGVRNCDDCSLGDWYVNEKKLPGGLSKLIEQINALDMKFGIWFEPEMISPDSDLYRAHPDWCLHVPSRDKSIARKQYVLDMSRQDVRDNIFEQMYAVLSQNKIDYVKWDFNRNLTEVGSALLAAGRQKEVFHRFVLGTYELMGRLTTAFPDLLLENCSGGGGRFDPAMLSFSPQIWCSDNTDPIERLTIQFGTSLCYPAATMGAHVSACKRTGLGTRAAVAMWGTFGYELDPCKLTDEEKTVIKAQISDYHKYYNVIHYGELYRLITPTENDFYCAWNFVSEDKAEALFTFVTMRKAECPLRIIRLKGLDAQSYYKDEQSGAVYSGALLMNAGINLTDIASGDGDSKVIHFIKV